MKITCDKERWKSCVFTSKLKLKYIKCIIKKEKETNWRKYFQIIYLTGTFPIIYKTLTI